MINLKIVNKLNELLNLVEPNLLVYWDREENKYYIVKEHVLIVYSSNKLSDIVDYIERNVRGWYLLHMGKRTWHIFKF